MCHEVNSNLSGAPGRGKRLTLPLLRIKMQYINEILLKMTQNASFLKQSFWLTLNCTAKMKIERDNCLRLQCEVKTNDHWVSFLGYHSNFFWKKNGSLWWKFYVFWFKHLIFIFLIVLVWSDNIVQAKIEISIFSLGKGRILAASACPSQTEGRAREGKDRSLLTSTLLALHTCGIQPCS